MAGRSRGKECVKASVWTTVFLVADVGREETGEDGVALSGGLGAGWWQKGSALGVGLAERLADDVGEVRGGHLDQDLSELDGFSSALAGDDLAGAGLVAGVHAASGWDTVVEGNSGDLLKTSLDVVQALLLLGEGLAKAWSVLQVVVPDLSSLGTELAVQLLGTFGDEADELSLKGSGAVGGVVLEAVLGLLEETALLVDLSVGGGNTGWVLVEEEQSRGAEVQLSQMAAWASGVCDGEEGDDHAKDLHVDLDVGRWYNPGKQELE